MSSLVPHATWKPRLKRCLTEARLCHARLLISKILAGLPKTSLLRSLIEKWVLEDLGRMNTRERAEQLSTAEQLAREIIDEFLEEFEAFYGTPYGPCRKHIKRGLQEHLGFWDEALLSEAFEEIRNQQVHLLESCCRKFQPDVFAPKTFDVKKLEGYFIRVARVQTRKVKYHANGPLVVDPVSAPEEPEDDTWAQDMMARLRDFWGTANKFPPEQQLEGLTSLLMGSLSGNALLEERTREFLEQRSAELKADHEKLNRRLSQLLQRRDTLNARLQKASHLDAKPMEEDLDSIELKLATSRIEREEFWTRLLPRPRDVIELLEGIDAEPRNWSHIRYRRIQRERALFAERHDLWVPWLRDTPHVPTEVLELAEQIEQLTANTPANPSAHGLTRDEKARRQEAEARWLDEVRALLSRVRALVVARATAAHLSRSLSEQTQNYLCDAECHLAFGVLTQDGIIAALRDFRGKRRIHILRSH